MRSYQAKAPQPGHVVVLETGDEVIAALARFATEAKLTTASFFGIGAVSETRLAYFDFATHSYVELPVDEQTEVVSLMGNLTLFQGQYRVHAHAILSRPDCSVVGGHLLRALVRPTLEIFVTETGLALERSVDPGSTLPLL